MQSRLVPSIGSVKGWAAAELEPVYARGRELCAQIRDPALTFRVLLEQWLMRLVKLELHIALELADKLLALAEDVRDPAMLLSANWVRGNTLLELGELVSANEHLQKAVGCFRPPATYSRAGGVTAAELRELRSGICTLACTDLAIPIVPG